MTNPKLMDAIRFLAGVCDGAQTKDGQGFDGTDTHYGKAIAQLDSWDANIEEVARFYTRKYGKQLTHAGFDVSEFAETAPETKPEGSPVKHIIDFDLATHTFALSFPFDHSTKEHLKREFGARWSPDDKTWRVGLEHKATLLKWAADEYRPVRGFRQRLREAEAGSTPTPVETVAPAPVKAAPTREIDIDGDVFVVRFEFDFKDTFKPAFMTRRWDGEQRRWTVNVTETDALIDFAKQYDFAWTFAAQDFIATRDQRSSESVHMSKAMTVDADIKVPGLKGELAPFQKVTVLRALQQAGIQ